MDIFARRVTTVAAALFVGVGATAACAQVLRQANPAAPPGLVLDLELPNIRSSQQRLDFQQRQQLNRELDSLTAGRQQPRIDIPVMKPNCRPRQVGNSYIAQTC